MKLYSITKGQLITIWVFGLMGAFAAFVNLSDYDPSAWSSVLLIGIPAFLIFYTIGWKSHRKNEGRSGLQNHCKNCGKKVIISGKFCVSCGKELYA